RRERAPARRVHQADGARGATAAAAVASLAATRRSLPTPASDQPKNQEMMAFQPPPTGKELSKRLVDIAVLLFAEWAAAV
ncbi:MAG: hypothetical protein KGI36_21980, partial [Burkholderiales bacterium]|nr:hypothetical protein [Burkholderiales bacterium]